MAVSLYSDPNSRWYLPISAAVDTWLSEWFTNMLTIELYNDLTFVGHIIGFANAWVSLKFVKNSELLVDALPIPRVISLRSARLANVINLPSIFAEGKDFRSLTKGDPFAIR